MSSLPNNYSEEDSCGPMFLSCKIQQNGDKTNYFPFSDGTTNLQKSPANTPAKSHSTQGMSAKMSWDIGNIDVLPDSANIYPLERTRVSVDHYVAPNETGQRICNCLRDLSISIISKKRNKIFAESFDRDVRFYIKLYKEKYDVVGSNNDGGSAGKYRVMVELQKRRGCAVIFGQMARAILQMAKSGNCGQENAKEDFRVSRNDSFSSLPHYQPKPTVFRGNNFGLKLEREVSASHSCDLKRIVYLISDRYMDSNLLGMQDLMFRTNSNTANKEITIHAAKLVLDDGEKNGSGCDLGLNALVKNFICGNFYDEDIILDDSFEEWYFSRMHYYALTVLANSMYALSKSDGGLIYLQNIVSTESWLDKKNGLLSALIKELTNAEKQPHNAYQSMRCLNVLFQVPAPVVHVKAIEWGASSVIWTALNIGRSCHSLLAHESELVMESSSGALKPGFGLMECAA